MNWWAWLLAGIAAGWLVACVVIGVVVGAEIFVLQCSTRMVVKEVKRTLRNSYPHCREDRNTVIQHLPEHIL
jgi:hypothetical protein